MSGFSLKSIKFSTKLFVGVLSILILAVTTILVIVTLNIRSSLLDLGERSIDNTLNILCSTLESQNNLALSKLNSDMLVFMSEVKNKGEITVSEHEYNTLTITNQETQESSTVKIPALLINGDVLNNSTELVDHLQSKIGGVATIFQIFEGKMIRISTNVLTGENKRAVDTYIPPNSEVSEYIRRGETYIGRAYVVDQWYVSMYKPVFNSQNKPVAALFVGVPILTEDLRAGLTKITANGLGYLFLYDSTGRVLIHPSHENSNIFELPDGLGEIFKNHKSGHIEYFWNGDKKFTTTSYFAPWDWNVGVGLSFRELRFGIDTAIITRSFVVTAIVLVIGVGIIVALVTAISRPLNEIAKTSLKMAEGDYTVNFQGMTRDAIGNLAKALNTAVSNTRQMIGEIIEATSALAASAAELTGISADMTKNSNTTVNRADAVNNAAEGVSSNMISVAAAMEQATMGMTTISDAAEEMSTTIHEIAQNAERARHTTSEAVVKVENASDSVEILNKAVEEINDFTDIIANISSQTNLLALNATIEAARAGEVGRGFAVVANEIKELSYQTTQATEDIRKKIDGIQTTTRTTIRETTGVHSTIVEMNEIVTTIATAVEEQSATTSEIASNVTQASLGIRDINSKVNTSADMTKNISVDMAGVKEIADEMNTNSATVQENSIELSKLAERLKELTERFKI